jgi:2-oxo-4-hydroxy-4-carboxy-5-ureidoimidazoline decarboxylase
MAIPACEALNALESAAAAAAFERCCGAHRWVEAMASARPFASPETLFETADRLWRQLGPDDWLEAFGHHPKIGDRDSLRQKLASTAQWAATEQSGTASADEDVLTLLAEGNADYEARHGFIFIVCATGKSATKCWPCCRPDR